MSTTERTRAAIIGGARRLMEAGSVPSIAQAATEAGVSRATAYRYFSSREELLTAVMEAHMQVVERVPARAGDDIAQRVRAVVRADYRLRRRFENQSRVWLSLVASPETREITRGWRIPPLAKALQGLPEGEARDRLLAALSLLVGPEAFVMLKDVWGLEGEDATRLLEWIAETLVSATVTES